MGTFSAGKDLCHTCGKGRSGGRTGPGARVMLGGGCGRKLSEREAGDCEARALTILW